MWSTIRTFLWQTRSALVIAPTVAAAVVGGNYLGVFNLLEWEIRDQFFRMRPFEGTDSSIVVVTIDEQDIQAAQDWPIPDSVLADLLTKISAQAPRAIGIDMYRDLPEEPGYAELVEVFKSTPTLVGVEKITGSRVDPPPVLAEVGQVAIADLVTDTDRRVRRALLTAQDQAAENAVKPGIATQVALMYLTAEGISLEALDAERQIYQLGKAKYQPLQSLEAGYREQALGGYQVLLNWRGGEEAFTTVPMREVLAEEITPDLLRDRIVLIGSIASSTNDFFETPYSSLYFDPDRSDDRVMPGVFVHANIASQLVQGALTGRMNITGFSGAQQHAWIVLWTIIGTSGCWAIAAAQQRRQQFKLVRGAFFTGCWVSVLFVIGAYGGFLSGILVPVMPPLTALTISGLATTSAYRQKSLKDANRALADANEQLAMSNAQLASANEQLESANNQLVDYSKTLESKVEERTRSLAKAKQAADAANQAKSDFLANMSHELRTPLNGILGYAQILERSDVLASASAEQARKGIRIIHQCGTHLLTLINDILDLSKIEARKLELHNSDFDLRTFLEGVAEICRIKAEQKGIAFVCRFSDELPAGICADEKRLRQVLINLLGNAIKFTDEGQVTLTVRLEDKSKKLPDQPEPETNEPELNEPRINESELNEPEIEEPKENNAEHSKKRKTHRLPIRFQIEDTGVGMRPEQLERIFLPFEQVGAADKKATGTGLGLAISQRIADMMNAPLQVDSCIGKGSTFWFTPAIAISKSWIAQNAHSNRITGIKSVGHLTHKTAPTVLIIDENSTSRQATKTLIDTVGFDLLEADSGTAGLQIAAERQPDVIITEIAVADIDGLSLIKQIKQRVKTTKLIVASVRAYESDRAQSLAAGADFFVPKPIEVNQLLTALQKALDITWNYANKTHRSATESAVESLGLEVNKETLSMPNITESAVDITPPNQEVLDALYHLTMMGDLNGLKGILSKLDAEDPDLHGFTAKLRKLSNQFQTKKIREFIKSFS